MRFCNSGTTVLVTQPELTLEKVVWAMVSSIKGISMSTFLGISPQTGSFWNARVVELEESADRKRSSSNLGLDQVPTKN